MKNEFVGMSAESIHLEKRLVRPNDLCGSRLKPRPTKPIDESITHGLSLEFARFHGIILGHNSRQGFGSKMPTAPVQSRIVGYRLEAN